MFAPRAAREKQRASRTRSTLATKRVPHLQPGADALAGAAFHEALEVLRAVLTGEMDRPLGYPLIAGEGGVLADLPVGIGAAEIRILHGCGQGRAAVPLGRYPRENGLELAQKSLGVARHLGVGIGMGVGLRRRERPGRVTARVVDQDARRAGLGAAHLPGVLVAEVGVGRTVGPAL